jgi:hypothetical protein
MSKLEEIFSEKNLLAYSRACLNLAVDMADTRIKKHPFDTLIIPSRGAVPFFLGMYHSLDKLSVFGGDFKEFYNGMAVQPMLRKLMPRDCEVSLDFEDCELKVLLAPFTADLNVEKIYPNENNDEYTDKTRAYWANFTASLYQPPEVRANNPFFKTFTDVVLRDIEGRDKIAEIYERFPTIKRAAMIDTVISGRASSSILKAFDGIAQLRGNENIMPISFLIVDENGKKLKKKFSRYLDSKMYQEQVTKYLVPRIVSEDEGAALLGVSATIYPSVMRGSKNFEIGGREFFVGAGSWHSSLDFGDNNSYFECFRRFRDTIYGGIDNIFEEDFNFEDVDGSRERFRDFREKFLKYGKETGILSHNDADVGVLKLNNGIDIGNSYETSSHVVHISFTNAITKRLLGKISSIPGVFSRTNYSRDST